MEQNVWSRIWWNLNEKTTKYVFQSFRNSKVDCKASEKKLEEHYFEVQVAPKMLMLVKIEILKTT